MESLLRYHNLIENKNNDEYFGHNLNMRLQDINNLAAELLNSEIVHKLSSAGFWVAYPEEQKERWQRLEMQYSTISTPLVLQQLDNSQHVPEKLKQEIQKIYEETLDFVQKVVPIASKGQISTCNNSVLNKEYTLKIDKNKNSIVLSFFKSIEKQFSQKNNSAALCKIRQANRAAGYFLQIDEELKKKETITAQELRLSLNQLIFWLNNCVENYLHACQKEKKGLEQYNHNIAELAAKAFPAITTKDKNKIRNVFHNINYDCRYPYETQEPQSMLHRLLKHTEILCTAPQLSEGFTLVGSAKAETNFIKLTKPKNAQQIMNSFYTAVNSVVGIIANAGGLEPLA